MNLALDRRNSPLPPIIVTSANSQVLSLGASDSNITSLFLQSDLIHAEGHVARIRFASVL